jgi:hypothetical protein
MCEPNDELAMIWLQMRQNMNNDEILPELAPMCLIVVTFA